MKLKAAPTRVAVGAVLAALILASFAQAANAGHGHGQWKAKKYRRDEGAPRAVARGAWGPSCVEIHRASPSIVPMVASFIGGMALGATLGGTHAHAAPEYFYYDPYCRERFATLEICLGHARHHRHHPRIVRVIEVNSGRCVRELSWHDGSWRDRNPYEEERDGCGDEWED